MRRFSLKGTCPTRYLSPLPGAPAGVKDISTHGHPCGPPCTHAPHLWPLKVHSAFRAGVASGAAQSLLSNYRKTKGPSPLLQEPNICNLLCPAGKREHQRTICTHSRKPPPLPGDLSTDPGGRDGEARGGASQGLQGLRAALAMSGAGSQTPTPNCPPRTKRAVWRSNKSQCGWQGDCTFQLECTSVGLAPEHQML